VEKITLQNTERVDKFVAVLQSFKQERDRGCIIVAAAWMDDDVV